MTRDSRTRPLGNDPVRDVLARFAARTPAPGGGSAAALTCALAAALTEMVAGFADAEAAGEALGRASELREHALELAERDLSSYRPVLEAVRLAADDERRAPAVVAALSSAAEVPLEVAQVAAEVAALADRLGQHVGRHPTGDAVAAAVLAESACQAAGALVTLNLQGAGDSRPDRAAEFVNAATLAREHALQRAHESR